MSKQRLFIAIDLPEFIKQEILIIQQVLIEHNLFKGTIVPYDNIHITLKFLGDIQDDKIEKIIDSLKEISFKNFYLKLNSLGVFTPDFIKVIWLGVISEELSKLKQEVDRSLSWLNLPDENEFTGHITLARVKSANKEKLLELIQNFQIKTNDFIVNSFTLKASVLTQEGSEYKNIEEFNLID